MSVIGSPLTRVDGKQKVTGTAKFTAEFEDTWCRLIVDDPDARGFVHWVVFNMSPTKTGGLAEAISGRPDAPPEGRNSFGKIGWGGPCPPSGTHRYVFTLLALQGLSELVKRIAFLTGAGPDPGPRGP